MGAIKDLGRPRAMKRCAAIASLAVWMAFVVALAGCGSSAVQKVEHVDRGQDAEPGKVAPEQHARASSTQAQADTVRLSVALTVEPYVIKPQDAACKDFGF